MRPGDYFDLVLFGSDVQSWKGSLVPASPANLQAAQEFVQRFYLAGGKYRSLESLWSPLCPLGMRAYTGLLPSFAATNLNGGLLRGIEILNQAHRSLPELSNHASVLIMLTDGEPTEGKHLKARVGRR